MTTKHDIPSGYYCHDENFKPCPYWSRRADKPEQESGYCGWLGKGDWELHGLSLLWDQVKECDVP